MSPRSIWRLLKETFAEWQQDKAPQLAAALAYYAVFSLAPLLVIAIAIAGAIFGEEAAQGEIVGQIQGVVGEDSARLIQRALSNASEPELNNLASLVSLVVLFFGASGVFAQLQDALNTVWDVRPRPGRAVLTFLSKRLLSFLMVVGVGIFLILSLILSAALSALSAYDILPTRFAFLWQFASFAITFTLITLLFATIYKFLPDARIAWKDVWIGAIITSVLFAIGRYLLGLYISRGGLGSTFGAAGSLVVLLAWIYYSAQIFFLGAEFTQVYARRHGSQILPSRRAMRVEESPAPEESRGG